MRARWLKPEFFTDKKIGTTDPFTALVYQALWCWADDGGVCICDPDWLKSQVFFRWDIFTLDVISKALRELYDLKMILVYKVGDDYFAQIRHWKRHQSVHKPAKFRHPRPDEQLTLSSSLVPPVIAGGSPALAPASPTPRILDGNSPRRLDGDVSAAPSQGDPGTVVPEPRSTATPPPPPEVDIPPVHTGKTAGERSLALRLETDRDRLSLTALCAVVPTPAVWVAECAARLDGLNAPGGRPTTPRQLADGLTEYVGSGRHLESPPSFRLFKAFLDKAATGSESAMSATDPNAKEPAPSQKSGPVSTGEAGALLSKIKTFREVATPQAGGQVESIRRTRVEELGLDVAQAYDAIGGSAGILKSDPSRWGLLVRDFANALTYARENPTHA